MSNAVGLFLKQVVINQAIPFELTLAPAKIKSNLQEPLKAGKNRRSRDSLMLHKAYIYRM